MNLTFRQIIENLVDEQANNPSLMQFRSVVGANQYLKAYELVANYVPQGGSVLDWGCGNGHFSYFLVQSGYQTSGYGFGPMSALCQQFSAEQYTYQDGDGEPIQLPYDAQQFGAVTSIGVLEHVRETGGDEIGSLKEIYRILKPGGVFICFHLPNQYSWIEYLNRKTGASGKTRYAHPYRYTTQQIKRFCQETGFSLIRSARYGALPRNVWSWANNIQAISHSHLVGTLYDKIDAVLSLPLSPICQCYLFVAQKPR